jgi:hypothetical protein
MQSNSPDSLSTPEHCGVELTIAEGKSCSLRWHPEDTQVYRETFSPEEKEVLFGQEEELLVVLNNS